MVLEHYQNFFKGHEIEIFTWNIGPIESVVPGFKVLRAAPGPRINLWSYCSIGASEIENEHSGLLEFIVHSSFESPRLVEMLAMVTYYHSSHALGIGHTLPIGEPWLNDSLCDHWLVSVPYPLGTELEICKFNNSHAHVSWLLPITEHERDFKVNNGLEELEKLFEDSGLEFWDVKRKSVV